jgi:hypothetical protein
MKKLFAALAALSFLAGPAAAQDRPAAKAEAPRPEVVKFELVPSGHFIVKVKVNGHGPYNLIFDTGAPTTLITPKIAREAKLVDKAKDRPLIPLFGMMGQVKVKDFRVGGVAAEDVSAMIMDHPTVKLFSKEYEKKYGSIEGIVGFPFFARFKMTVDYAAREMTFVPSGYKGGTDVMQDLMQTVMNAMGSSKPQPRIAAPAGLWGLELDKKAADEAAGVDVRTVLPGGPAAEAGLKAGDRILTIDGRWTDTIPDAYTAASFARPGKPVAVVVKRAGKEVNLTLSPKTGL